MSEMKLAVLVAVATCIGGIASTFLDKTMLDASASRETDVQIVQLAIGVLSKDFDFGDDAAAAKDRALRAWAVDSLNAVSRVKLPSDAKAALVDGSVNLKSTLEIIRSRLSVGDRVILSSGADGSVLTQVIPGITNEEMRAIFNDAAKLAFEKKTDLQGAREFEASE